jgi:hypothetical protein
MLIWAIALFLVGWSPKLLLNLLTRSELIAGAMRTTELEIIKKTANLLPFVHASINSIIYMQV